MDEKGATSFCELLARTQAEPTTSILSLPMYLIMVGGEVPGAMLRLSTEGTRLGRAPDNTYPLTESTVSRYHAFLGVDAQGCVRLTDLASTNGTFVNGTRLAPHTPAGLQDGDRIQVGSSIVLKFARLDPYEEQFQREMFERTIRDELTGLYNRTYFHSQVARLANFGLPKGLGLAVLMLDIDHFKGINDTYGHAVGDIVLREVSRVLRESSRADDLVARYGGEEFVIALPAAASSVAVDRAERIRSGLCAHRLVIAKTSLRVTASVGLAFAPPGKFRAVRELITVADQGLYEAKNTGRNRVVFRDGEGSSASESIATMLQ